MTTHERPTIVTGAMSSIADLGKDGAWLQGWLKEDPSRLGLGPLEVADADPVQDEEGNPAFLATDDDRYFSVDVRLGEMEASHGFQVLDDWARNRVRHPDKTHVAVLVTESASDRYRTTLEALADHLPLVVVELSVWRGKNEAILAPRVALRSHDLELAIGMVPADAQAADDEDDAPVGDAQHDEAPGTEAGTSDGEHEGEHESEEISDPWRLPRPDATTADSGTLAGVGS